MPDVKDYAAKFVIHRKSIMNGAEEYIKLQIEDMEKEAIYKAVKQLSGWIAIKSEIREESGIFDTVEYTAIVHCHPVTESRIYIPVWAMSQMPPDVYKCVYCGGYTHNDKRGHCGVCGAPRDDSYLDNFHA